MDEIDIAVAESEDGGENNLSGHGETDNVTAFSAEEKTGSGQIAGLPVAEKDRNPDRNPGRDLRSIVENAVRAAVEAASAEGTDGAPYGYFSSRPAESGRNGGAAAQDGENGDRVRAFREKVDAEIAEIGKLDPSIRTPADLLKMPGADRFREYVRRGNNFTDAYYLTNREKLESAAAEAARRQTLNSVRSREHLSAVGNTRSSEGAPVPAEVMKYFRLFLPDASESEIRSYYNRSGVSE